jgi:hypothetical protein
LPVIVVRDFRLTYFSLIFSEKEIVTYPGADMLAFTIPTKIRILAIFGYLPLAGNSSYSLRRLYIFWILVPGILTVEQIPDRSGSEQLSVIIKNTLPFLKIPIIPAI